MVPYNKHMQPGVPQWATSAMNATVVLDQAGNSTFTNLDEISGKVMVRCTKSTDVTTIVVKLEGESRSRLLSVDPGPRPERTRPFTEYHKILYKVQMVFPPAEVIGERLRGKLSYTLPVGQHEYPFKFKLPFNNSCHSVNSQMPTNSLQGMIVDASSGNLPTQHVKRTLPPTLSGFPGEAEIRYFVKATVTLSSFFKENPRAYMPFNFLPIEPPRLATTGSEVFARQKHGFSEINSTQSKGKMNMEKRASTLIDPHTPSVSVDARLPQPATLTCNQAIPLRLLVKKLDVHQSPLYLQSLQISLIGFTRVRAHTVHRIENTSWVIVGQSNMKVPIGTSSDLAETEIILDDRLWRGRPLPNNVAPSFDTCNISRSYQLDIRIGLSYGDSSVTQPQSIVLHLRLDTFVYSGISPPAELLQAMAERRANLHRTSATEVVSEKLRMETDPTSEFGANQIPPTPFDETGPSGSHGMPAAPGSLVEQQPPMYSEAPPSYEDAVATNMQPIDAPRPDYAPPAVANDDVLRRDEKRGWVD